MACSLFLCLIASFCSLFLIIVASQAKGNQVREEEDVEWGKVEKERLVEYVEDAVDEPSHHVAKISL